MGSNYFTPENSWRHLFFITGLTADEFYTDGGLKLNIEQLAHLELKKSGYERIVFYDKDNKLYCYDDDSFALLRVNGNNRKDKNVEVGNNNTLIRQNRGLKRGRHAQVVSSNTGSHSSTNKNKSTLDVVHTSGEKDSNVSLKSGILIKSGGNVPLHLGMRDTTFVKRQIDAYMHDAMIKTAVVINDPNAFEQEFGREPMHSLTAGYERMGTDNENILVFLYTDGNLANFYRVNQFDNEDKDANIINVECPNTVELKNMLMYLRWHCGLKIHMRDLDSIAISLRQAMALSEHQIRIKEVYFRFIAFGTNKLLTPDLCYEIVGVKKPDSAKNQLSHMIGMQSVKDALENYDIGNKPSTANLKYLTASRLSPNLPLPEKKDEMIHFVLTGNPGTGKTTVAKLIGQMFYEMGYLESGHVVETDRSKLVAGFVGQTAIKTMDCIQKAMGGVLFIDEAYTLAVDEEHGSDTYRKEAINTLIAEMENHRDDMVVIMAGYKDEMDDLLRSNPGFVSRMPYEIRFENYSREQLSQIFFMYASRDFVYGVEFEEKVKEYFSALPNNIYYSPTFANARFVRNLFERTMSKAITRAQLSKQKLMTLLSVDFEEAVEEINDSAAGAMSFGKDKSGVMMFNEERVKISFADVRGEDEAKELLQEMVDFLKNPKKYQERNARIPHGALLYGPPGTGKTMLAKAVAGEAGVPFLSIGGGDLGYDYHSSGKEKVRSLFAKARKIAPSIVFIDEIDAVGGNRNYGGSNSETLIQLLTELDGFDESGEVIILAATNRPEYLDPALKRPGRFDREIPVHLPDLVGRMDILSHYLESVPHDANIDLNKVARLAAGSSGAEIRNIVNEANLKALRENRDSITQHDLEESIDVISVGYVTKNKIMSDHEKWVTCYHEIGHALAGALQSHSAPVEKITVVPRTSGALGFAQQLETHPSVMFTKTEMENRIVTICAGRAAEEVHFHEITTGASNDIEKATIIARDMVVRYGMTDEFDMVCLEKTQGGFPDGGVYQACSETTASAVDQKVIEIVRTQHNKAVELLKGHENKLDELAEFLYNEETISGDQFMAILNK